MKDDTTHHDDKNPAQDTTDTSKGTETVAAKTPPEPVTRAPPQIIKPDAKPGDSTNKLFDLDRLRLQQNFDKQVGVKKLLTHVPVHKPGNQEWARVSARVGWSLSTQVLTLKAERETYLVDPSLWMEIPAGLLKAVTLVVAITRQKALMVWPLRLPREDGRLDLWGESELDAAERAKSSWIRLSANMSAGMYDIFEAAPGIPEPEWPEASFEDLIRLAFKGRLIESADHPTLRMLRGES